MAVSFPAFNVVPVVVVVVCFPVTIRYLSRVDSVEYWPLEG